MRGGASLSGDMKRRSGARMSCRAFGYRSGILFLPFRALNCGTETSDDASVAKLIDVKFAFLEQVI
jgi:hypothetical protein